MQTPFETYIAAKQGLTRVEKTIAFIGRTLYSTATFLFFISVLYGQKADFGLGIKLIAFALALQAIRALGLRYAQRKRDEALAAWTREVTGYEYLSREQASRLLSGFMQEFGHNYWRYREAADGTPSITNEGSSLALH